MSDDLTLPGDLPGLLRQSSPIILQTGAGPAHGVVVGPSGDVPGGWEVAWAQVESTGGSVLDDFPPSALALDLTDPTGRIHLLWWAEEATKDRADFFTTPAEERAIDLVRHGKDCTEADIIALRGLGLRIAGRTA